MSGRSVSPGFFDFGEGKSGGKITLAPGPVSSTLDPVAIPDTAAQDSRNCNVQHGIWELDRRYRMAQTGLGTGQGLGYVQSYTFGRLVSIQGSRPYWSPIAPDTNTLDQLGGAAQTFGPLTTADLALGTGWSSWSFGPRCFFANGDGAPPAGGSSVYYVELDASGVPTWIPQWLNYKPDGQFTSGQERPEYPTYDWISGTDSVADGTDDHFGNAPTIKDDGRIFVDNTNFDPTGSQTIKFSVNVTIGQLNSAGVAQLDLSKVEFVEIEFEGTDRMDSRDSNYILGLQAHGSSTVYNAQAKAITDRDETTKRIWFDISNMPRAARAKVVMINIRGAIRTDGKSGAYISGLTLGGSYLNGTTQQPSIKGQDNTGNIEYAAQYWTPAAGGSYSSGMYSTLDGTLALGERADTDLPYMGSVTKLSVVKNQSAPFNVAGSKVFFYRKVSDRWYQLGSADNTGDPNVAVELLDYFRQPETAALTDVTDRLATNPYSASSSGGVAKVNGGVEWKGSNCYFDTDGKLYISRTDDYTDVLWPGIVRPTDFDDIGQPRSLQVSGLRDAILCAVAGDVLWLFTRRETYAMAGGRPYSADPPFKMMGVRGAVSKWSAALFETGALVATDEGLYYLYLDRPLAGVSANQSAIEMTADVRGSWKWLLGSSPELTTVTVYLGEIYVTCGSRCLHRTKDGQWLPNDFAQTFVRLWSDPRYGLVGLSDAGELCKFGLYPTDGGTDAAGETGKPVSWWWTSKRYTDMAQVAGVYALFTTALDQATIEFEFTGCRNTQRITSRATDSSLLYEQLNRSRTVGPPWWEVTVRGSGFDRVQKVTLDIEVASTPRK